jgi:redox-sensitive bicupin YhaK (pirin superfamily)
MLTLRRAQERRHRSRQRSEAWITFDPRDGDDALLHGFAGLALFEEGLLPPSASTRKPLEEAEIITYVREGAVGFEDSMGRRGIIGAGEFQRMTAGPGIRYSQMNISPTTWARVFQVVLRPAAPGLQPGYEQKAFGATRRRSRLCPVVSPDAREGSLRIHQDALVYSGLFAPGRHVVHELAPQRSLWLHIVAGEASVGDALVRTGDGLGVLGETKLAFTARSELEVLLVELPAPPVPVPPSLTPG